jgi:hypothetical protein
MQIHWWHPPALQDAWLDERRSRSTEDHHSRRGAASGNALLGATSATARRGSASVISSMDATAWRASTTRSE